MTMQPAHLARREIHFPYAHLLVFEPEMSGDRAVGCLLRHRGPLCRIGPFDTDLSAIHFLTAAANLSRASPVSRSSAHNEKIEPFLNRKENLENDLSVPSSRAGPQRSTGSLPHRRTSRMDRSISPHEYGGVTNCLRPGTR